MKLISWNVNGLRAVVNKGFMEFFDEINADIFAAKQVGKNKMLNVLDYLIREKKSEQAKPKEIKELENRKKIISKLED